jgi:hypothetical protein
MGDSQPRRWGTIEQAMQEAVVSRRTISRLLANGSIYGEQMSNRRIRVDLNTVTGRPLQSPVPPLEDHIRRLVEQAPPLTPEQRDKIASILRVGA